MPDESEVIAAQSGADAQAEPLADVAEAATAADQQTEDRTGTDVHTGDGAAGEMVSRAELEKVIAQRQAAKARARKAEQQLAEAEARTGAGEAEASPEQGREDTRAQAQAIEDENAQLKRQLTSVLRDQGLRAAAAAAGAVNPDQVVALLRLRVHMTLGEDGRLAPAFVDEAGRPIADDDGAVPDVQTFVGLFLSLPENANLVRAGATPGSGARPAGGASGPDARPRSLDEFNGLPEERRMQWALEMGPEKLRTLLGMGRAQDQGFL